MNAPQFISIHGERIWACLDGEWTTTDTVPRDMSPDPRRVYFLKEGLRKERTVVPILDFPSAIMPQAASHPLIIAENFRGDSSVGIACRTFDRLFNNNDSILRCIHSMPAPVPKLESGETATQDGVILFCRGNHSDLLRHFDRVVSQAWR